MNVKFKIFMRKIIKNLVRNAAKVFWICPVKNNRVICIPANRGDFSCNPKYIALALNKVGKYDVIVALNSPQTSDCPIESVKYLSLKFFYYITTAKVIIENSGIGCYPKRKQQYVINTWHGGGAYKKCGSKEMLKVENAKASGGKCLADMILSSCKTFSQEVVSDMFGDYSGEILPSGLPRNDIFYSEESKNIRKKIHAEFGINDDKIILLYAPTFRGRFKSFYSDADTNAGDIFFDLESVCSSIEKRFGGKPVIIYRAHAAMNHCSNIVQAIDATSYPDMQELLCAADILISDYSSTIWDFSLTKKPCFLYCPDLDYYLNEDRGVYTPIETWPGILCRTNEELEQAILNFDEAEYVKKVEKHHADLGSYETGHACEQVCKRIAEVCGIEEES